MLQHPDVPHLFEIDPATGKYGKRRLDFLYQHISGWRVCEKLPGKTVTVCFDGVKTRYDLWVDGRGATEGEQKAVSALLPRDVVVSTLRGHETWLYFKFFGGEWGFPEFAKEPVLVLFDVFQRCWAEMDEIIEIAMALDVHKAPFGLEPYSREAVEATCRDGFDSLFASVMEAGSKGELAKTQALGLVARYYPNLYRRDGTRVMWQLECSRFDRLVTADSRLILPPTAGRLH